METKSNYSPLTSGMQIQVAGFIRATTEMHGDLRALAILREKSRLPFESRVGNEYYPGISFPAKKKLWNAQSHIISRVAAKLFPMEDVNSIQSILARELIGLASYHLIKEEKMRC